MALDEASYPATKLSVSATALPLNTPPKAVKWNHLDGTFQLILSVVTSKMKLQIKQGAKAKVTSTYNKLTPAQKKNMGAPRLQYQDRRISFRYPSSPQVDNGLSERFQITLEDPASVLAIVKKLTPFFVIVPPAPPPARPPPTTTTSNPEASGSKKRKSPGDSDEADSSASLPQKKKRKESDVETQVGSSDSSKSQLAQPAQATESPRLATTQSKTPSQQVQSAAKNATPPKQISLPFAQARPAPLVVDPAIEALKAQLLQGIPYETVSPVPTSPVVSKATSPIVQPAPKPLTPQPAAESYYTQTKSYSQIFRSDLAPTPVSGNTSIEQVEIEIDLLPRSPLIDTTTPQFTQILTQTQSTRIDAYPSLTGLDFTDVGELLNCAFPPMQTAEEEAAERRRVEMDAEEWGDSALGSTQRVPLGSSTLSNLNRMSMSLDITDDDIYDSLDRGELNDGFLAICYRVTMAAYQQHDHNQPPPVSVAPFGYFTPPTSAYAPTPTRIPSAAPQYQFYQPTHPRRDSDYTPQRLYYGHTPPQDHHLYQHPAYDQHQYEQDYQQYQTQYENYDTRFDMQEQQQYQETNDIDDIDD